MAPVLTRREIQNKAILVTHSESQESRRPVIYTLGKVIENKHSPILLVHNEKRHLKKIGSFKQN